MLVDVSPARVLRPMARLALHDLRSIVLPIAMALFRASHLIGPRRGSLMRVAFRVRGMIFIGFDIKAFSKRSRHSRSQGRTERGSIASLGS